MENFNFYQPTRTHFGAGRLNSLGKVVKKYGTKCLLVTTTNNEDVLRPLYDRVKKILKEAGVTPYHFDDVVPNPTIGSIEKAMDIVNKEKVEVILAVGGGSSMDTAKSVALFYGAGKVNWQQVFGEYTDPFAEYEPLSDPVLPIIGVPTTAGTGSELTQAMVISDPENDEKMCIFHDKVFPSEAIIDSELMRTLPPKLTAITGFDAFSHAFESYMRECASPYTQALGIMAIKAVITALPKLIKDTSNFELRDEMARAEMFAGISLANAAASIPHPLSEIIGGVTPRIPHGQCLATIYPKYIAFEIANNPNKCAEIARLFNPALNSASMTVAAQALADEVGKLITSIGLNHTLSQLGVTTEELELMKTNFLFDVLPFASKEELVAMVVDSF